MNEKEIDTIDWEISKCGKEFEFKGKISFTDETFKYKFKSHFSRVKKIDVSINTSDLISTTTIFKSFKFRFKNTDELLRNIDILVCETISLLYEYRNIKGKIRIWDKKVEKSLLELLNY